MQENERFMRQIDLLNPKTCKEKITVIGSGSVGSYTVLSLAKMGLSNITVYDGDTIEEHNFANQFFPITMKNQNKTTALKDMVKQFTDVNIEAIPNMYKGERLKGIVISALDTMKGRKLIFDKCNNTIKLLIDARTGPELFKLYTVDMTLDLYKKEYAKSLHPDEEADEAPCTARSIIYGVLLVSAYICNQVKRYLMNEEYKREIYQDIKYNVAFTK